MMECSGCSSEVPLEHAYYSQFGSWRKGGIWAGGQGSVGAGERGSAGAVMHGGVGAGERGRGNTSSGHGLHLLHQKSVTHILVCFIKLATIP